MRFTKRLVGAFAVLALVAIVAATLAPVSLATKATPSVSLKAKPTTVKVGQTVTLSGTVNHAVANNRIVHLWLVQAKEVHPEGQRHDLQHGRLQVHGQGGGGRPGHSQGHLQGRHDHLQEQQGHGHDHEVTQGGRPGSALQTSSSWRLLRRPAIGFVNLASPSSTMVSSTGKSGRRPHSSLRATDRRSGRRHHDITFRHHDVTASPADVAAAGSGRPFAFSRGVDLSPRPRSGTECCLAPPRAARHGRGTIRAGAAARLPATATALAATGRMAAAGRMATTRRMAAPLKRPRWTECST